MAYVYDPNLELQKKKQQDGGAPSSVVPPTAPSVSGGGQTQQQRPASSGNYTNLQQYLNANQGSGFGTKTAGKVGEEVTGAQTAQDTAGSEFRNQVGQNTVNYDENLANQAKTDASGVLGNEASKNAFEKMRSGTYGGPSQLTDLTDQYTAAQGATQKGQQAADLTKSEQGQRTLLDRYYARPTYTGGEKSLDQFLLQGDQAGQQGFKEQQSKAANLGTGFQSLQDMLAQEANQGKATSQQTADKLQNEFLGDSGYLTGLNSQYQQRATQADQDINSRQTDLGNQIASGHDPFGTLAGTTLYNVDPRQYLNRQAAPTVGQTLNQGEAGNYNALNQLLNQQNAFDTSGAGQFDINKSVGIDQNGLNTAIAPQAQAYQNYINNTGSFFGDFNSQHDGNLNMNNLSQGAKGQVNNNIKQLYNDNYINQLQNSPYAQDKADAQELLRLRSQVDSSFGANRRIS